MRRTLQPPLVLEDSARSAVKSAPAAYRASWAACLPAIRARAPEVAARLVQELQASRSDALRPSRQHSLWRPASAAKERPVVWVAAAGQCGRRRARARVASFSPRSRISTAAAVAGRATRGTCIHGLPDLHQVDPAFAILRFSSRSSCCRLRLPLLVAPRACARRGRLDRLRPRAPTQECRPCALPLGELLRVFAFGRCSHCSQCMLGGREHRCCGHRRQSMK